ncbi:lipocalin family protein [Zhouia sp. PK063]|uniref:lipocalin family protein n=1 Tax=Zhouia sp. PK063 TaxID=3373602 RepID=UPI0037AB10F7
MKLKKWIAAFSIIALLASCSLSKTNRTYRKTIAGNWTLTNVSYANNQGLFKSTLFNDVSAQCFQGSTWFFRSNNSTGNYNINSASCNPGERYIRWSVVESDMGPAQLQFKFTDEKKNDVSGGVGYRLNIESLTDTQMVLTTNTTTDGGEAITVKYNFVRNAN